MKKCLVTERKNSFEIGPGGQFDTNDVNIAAAMGADRHFFMGEEDLSLFAPYDLIMVKMSKIKEPYDSSWMGFVPRIKQRWPGKLVALYQEAEVDWPLKRPIQDQIDFFKAVKQCDVFLAHNNRDADFYAAVKGDDKVFAVPTPLPIGRISDMRLPRAERWSRKEIAFGSAFDDRAYGLFGYLVAARELKHSSSFTLVQYARSVYADTRNEDMRNCFGVHFESLPYLPWLDFCARMSKVYVSMNLMPAAAAGRDTIMFAALGIPHIGNYRLDAMQNCFPELTVDPVDTFSSSRLLHRLLRDEDFYVRVSETAMKQAERHHTISAVNQFLKEQFKEKLGINIGYDFS